MNLEFAEQSWPALKVAIERNSLILLPVGMLEEHGPHLPVATDSIIATEVSWRVAERLKERIPVLVLPTVNTGYTGRRVARWPGAVSVQPETLIALAYDILDSLVRMGFRKIVIINGHGQNPAMLETAVRKIADNHEVSIALTNTYAMVGTAAAQIRRSTIGGCGEHAGEFETALLLYLRPDLVDMSQATDIDTVSYHTPFFPGDMFGPRRASVYWSAWAVSQPQLGVLGDPTVATVETGRLFFETILANYEEFLLEYYRFPEGKPNK